METLIHADIFFFITTIAIVVISLILCVLGFYAFRILRNVDEIAERVTHEGNQIVSDVSEVRMRIKEKGIKFSDILGVLSGLLSFRKKFSRKTKRKTHEETK